MRKDWERGKTETHEVHTSQRNKDNKRMPSNAHRLFSILDGENKLLTIKQQTGIWQDTKQSDIH